MTTVSDFDGLKVTSQREAQTEILSISDKGIYYAVLNRFLNVLYLNIYG
jgi:hypothetical protein